MSRYLSVAPQAFLTEEEVVWRNTDAISLLSDQAGDARIVSRRRDWDGVSNAGVMGTDILPEAWQGLDEIVDGANASSEFFDRMDVKNKADGEMEVLEGGGEGNEGYWMKSDWEGTVEGTHSWERLFNVTTK